MNGLDLLDYFSFTLTDDSIVTVAVTNVPSTEFGGININSLDNSGGGGSDTYGTVLTAYLPAGGCGFDTSVMAPGDDAGPIFELDDSGYINVESPPLVCIGNATVAVGASGTTNATFTVSLSKVSPLPVMVNYNTADGTATANYTYDPVYGTLTFPPGQTNETIMVTVNGGALTNAVANFYVNLSYNYYFSFTGAHVSATPGTGTILNEAYPPVFQAVTQSNGMIYFSWSTVPGQTCQVQASTDLNSTNWLNLGNPVTATNLAAGASDFMTNSQCFYRIEILP